MFTKQENEHNKSEQRTDLLPNKYVPFRNVQLDIWKEGVLVAIGNVLTLSLIMTIVGTIMFWLNDIDKKAATSLISYSLLIVFLLLVVKNNIKDYIPKFLNWMPYVVGVGIGLAIMGFDQMYTSIVNLFYPLSIGGNESGIREIVNRFPIASIFIFGLVGPMCEELTYRVGLFNLFKRWKRVWAYIFTGIIFGFIHFDYQGNIAVEFILLPTYIVPGVILSLAYDLYDLPCSFTAHITNNLIVLIALAARAN